MTTGDPQCIFCNARMMPSPAGGLRCPHKCREARPQAGEQWRARPGVARHRRVQVVEAIAQSVDFHDLHVGDLITYTTPLTDFLASYEKEVPQKCPHCGESMNSVVASICTNQQCISRQSPNHAPPADLQGFWDEATLTPTQNQTLAARALARQLDRKFAMIPRIEGGKLEAQATVPELTELFKVALGSLQEEGLIPAEISLANARCSVCGDPIATSACGVLRCNNPRPIKATFRKCVICGEHGCTKSACAAEQRDDALSVELSTLKQKVRALAPQLGTLLWCPKCQQQHIDDGEWAVRLHRTHQCGYCGHEWACEAYAFGARHVSMEYEAGFREALNILRGRVALCPALENVAVSVLAEIQEAEDIAATQFRRV